MSNLSDEARKAATKYERADCPKTAGLFQGLADALDAAEAREAGLRNIINAYVRHAQGCSVYTRGATKCDCGLHAALNNAPAERGEEVGND